MINKEFILDTIELAQFIAHIKGDKQMILSRYPENQEKYNTVIKPKIDSLIPKYGERPDDILNDFLKSYMVSKKLEAIFRSEGKNFYTQVVNSFTWACIFNKDETNLRKPHSHSSQYPQLYVLIDESSLCFGFCYGFHIPEDDIKVKVIKENKKILDNLFNILKKDPNLKVLKRDAEERKFSELKINSPEELAQIWSVHIEIVKIFSKENIPQNIEPLISETFDNLLELFNESSLVKDPLQLVHSTITGTGSKDASKNLPKIWLFATPQSNYEIALEKGIWAYKKSGIAKKIKNGDILIFYVNDLSAFTAIATVEGDSYNSPSIIWDDEQKANQIIYPFQIKIKIILQGQVDARELVNRLSFIKNKVKWGMYLVTAPGNFSNPIPESDYDIILNAFQKEPRQIVDVLVTPKKIPNEISYFILRTGFDDYPDSENTYTFKAGIKNSNQLIEAANNVKFIYLEEAEFYATGQIGNIVEDKKSNGIFYNATVNHYTPIHPIDLDFPLPRTRINQITKEQYELIISKPVFDISIIKSNEYYVNLDSFEINTLYFEEDQKKRLIQQITRAIAYGKHLILIGPPGTGKSKLAKIICEAYGLSLNEYEMCTATSDWSTFDTIGGYRPNPQKNGELEFSPGIFLQCFQDKKANPINKWLILDEINRADIDKAFGSLFSALTGDTITIPFERSGNEIQIIGFYDEDFKGNNETFIIPKTWRLIATMNNIDKSSLYQMSYAFMRRFAFIHVEVPTIIDDNLIRIYVKIWGSELDADITSKLAVLWKKINEVRKIGPSIIEDMYLHLLNTRPIPAYSEAINMYVIPQFEGLEENKITAFVADIIKKGMVDQPDILIRFASDFFDIPLQKF